MQHADAVSLRARLEREDPANTYVVRESGPRDFEVVRIGIPHRSPEHLAAERGEIQDPSSWLDPIPYMFRP